MRRVIGWLLVTATVMAGAYVGIWLAFIGGIIQIFDGAQATSVNIIDVVWGLFRALILPGTTAFTTWFIVVVLGGYLLDWDQTEPVRPHRSYQYQ